MALAVFRLDCPSLSTGTPQRSLSTPGKIESKEREKERERKREKERREIEREMERERERERTKRAGQLGIKQCETKILTYSRLAAVVAPL